jgi:hypothetical protein
MRVELSTFPGILIRIDDVDKSRLLAGETLEKTERRCRAGMARKEVIRMRIEENHHPKIDVRKQAYLQTMLPFDQYTGRTFNLKNPLEVMAWERSFKVVGILGYDIIIDKREFGDYIENWRAVELLGTRGIAHRCPFDRLEISYEPGD